VRTDRPSARSTDPRAVRTRAKLTEAFGRLAESTAPGDITVAALTQAAGVHRTAFYKQFASPEEFYVDLLRDLFDVISSSDTTMRVEQAVSGHEASRRAMSRVVGFVAARRATYAPLLGFDAAPGVLRAITEACAELTARAIARMQDRPATVDVEVVSQFLAHGLVGVIGRWLADSDGRLSDDAVVDQLVQCFPAWLTAPAGGA
jgi:AcrR family transcriptional regulator